MFKIYFLVIILIIPFFLPNDASIFAADGIGVFARFTSSHSDTTAPKRNIIEDAANYFCIYAHDGWTILTSPTRINKKGAYWLGGIALVGGIAFVNDEAIMDATHRNSKNAIYRSLANAGEKVEPLGLVKNMNPVYAIGAVTGYMLKIKPLEDISIQLHEALLFGSLSRRLVVFSFGRARPYENKGPYSFGNSAGRSFFSGHTSTAFQMATILSHHVDSWPFTVACYGYSTIMGFQRLDTNAHWPSDVLLGAVFGITIGKTIIKLHQNRNLKIMPNVSQSHIGIGITYVFE